MWHSIRTYCLLSKKCESIKKKLFANKTKQKAKYDIDRVIYLVDLCFKRLRFSANNVDLHLLFMQSICLFELFITQVRRYPARYQSGDSHLKRKTIRQEIIINDFVYHCVILIMRSMFYRKIWSTRAKPRNIQSKEGRIQNLC